MAHHLLPMIERGWLDRLTHAVPFSASDGRDGGIAPEEVSPARDSRDSRA
jgi:hypothetical protein